MNTNMPEMQPMINMLNRTEIPSTGASDGGRMRTHNRTQMSTRERNDFTSQDEDVVGPSTYRDYAGPSSYRDEAGPSTLRNEPGTYPSSTNDVYIPTPVTLYQPAMNMYSGCEFLDLNLGYYQGDQPTHSHFNVSPVPYHLQSPQSHSTENYVADAIEKDIAQEPVGRVRRNRRPPRCRTGGHLGHH
ncbi:PREDICTED: uncharacterized protein LOC105951685 [Erythranthe guttata]|uniref:uncharacterized protein LOC105951685 n=1 Tax=Erythranthe guttata TaxID=4155 RepID=UPI00064DA36A|nr:PREDICTED: uncharacterized protein LOC105951685 [Erythranthe guttata]|eukprot:XP_012830588.1 PREDICTED: uncharacterized protein LOC105951685 [Erythranthe guttata]